MQSNDQYPSDLSLFIQRAAQPMLLLHGPAVVQANAALLDLLEFRSVKELASRPLSDLCQANGLPVDRQLADFIEKGQGGGRWEWLGNSGKRLQCEVQATCVSVSGEPHLHLSLRHLDEYGPNAEVQLQLYQQVFESSIEAVIITDTAQRILYANRAFCEVTGYGITELLGKDIRLLRSEKHDDSFFHAIATELQEKGFWSGEIWDRNSKGQDFLCHVRLSAIVDEYRQPRYFVGVYTDVSGQDSQIMQLREMAYHDELTGLPNRALLMQLLPHQISQCRREKGHFGLMFLDLDKFKPINDKYGHEVGDELLKQVAERLREVLRNSDTVARLGGDEFVVLVSNTTGPESIARVAEKIHEALGEPILVNGQQLDVGVSIGISMFPQNSENPDTLLHQADIAMYRAKKRGENQYVFYCEDLNQELVNYKLMEQEIRDGLKRGEFIPYYQPQVDSRSGEIVGVECLARWQHRERGIVPPNSFISVAERSGLIQEVFLQVLGQAIKDIGQWKTIRERELQVSVNISGHQFCDHQNITQMSEMLKESGIRPGSLKTEIAERSLMSNGQYLLERLSWVKTAGFSIALDDFGSGYSSIRQLKILPVDTLKIDRSYLSSMEDEPRDRIVIKAIIQLSKTLGIGVVAQGVEREEQVRFLEENGCHVMQGYHFSRPLPADEFALLLAARQSA
ncbi:putative bifunctional diguanylate cyclase/phosphodiesterase [Bowmanella dokdonensis]|uniref:EAL domain-containing protein n=1 Tax=Bowmanella dokdonensis TaxID=751969 RepID=A0A939DSX7_9ALTE|nr:EAL domain-containing protein [Bowmanella dokdonensis]MBN7827605.1 EAL domain-containing protein [Bowmanella dokdonensis]